MNEIKMGRSGEAFSAENSKFRSFWRERSQSHGLDFSQTEDDDDGHHPL